MNTEKAKKFAKLVMIGGVLFSVVAWLSLMSMSTASAAPLASKVGTAASVAAASLTTDFPEECQTTTTEEMELTTCNSGHASSSSTASAVSVARLKFRGRVVLEYLVRGGLTRQQIRGARCYTSHAGWNTGRTSDGRVGKYWDTRDQRICHTGNGPSGWQVVKCGNFYYPQTRPPKRFRTFRNPVVVRSFQNWTLRGSIHVEAESEGESTATADAVCEGSSGHGSGYGYGFASAEATLWFRFRGRTQMRARGAQVRSEFELSLHAQAYAKARTLAKTRAEADAWCTTNQPPPADQPPNGEIVQFPAHLFVNGEFRVKVVGSDPQDGGNVNLTYTVTGQAVKVVDADHPEICDIEGVNKVCTFWIRAKGTPGDATITLTVTDSDGNTFETSKTFPVVGDRF